MLGSQSNPSFKAKAAETAGVLPFVVDLLTRHMPKFILMGGQEKLAARLLLASGTAAMEFSNILNKHLCRKMEVDVCQSLLNAYLRFFSLLERAGCTGTPKCHLNIHMCQRAVFPKNVMGKCTQ